MWKWAGYYQLAVPKRKIAPTLRAIAKARSVNWGCILGALPLIAKLRIRMADDLLDHKRELCGALRAARCARYGDCVSARRSSSYGWGRRGRTAVGAAAGS